MSGKGRNQFTAAVRFDAIVWRAYDEKTGAVATVADAGIAGFKWSVYFGAKGPTYKGITRRGPSARAACRRVIAKEAKR